MRRALLLLAPLLFAIESAAVRRSSSISSTKKTGKSFATKEELEAWTLVAWQRVAKDLALPDPYLAAGLPFTHHVNVEKRKRFDATKGLVQVEDNLYLGVEFFGHVYELDETAVKFAFLHEVGHAVGEVVMANSPEVQNAFQTGVISNAVEEVQCDLVSLLYLVAVDNVDARLLVESLKALQTDVFTPGWCGSHPPAEQRLKYLQEMAALGADMLQPEKFHEVYNRILFNLEQSTPRFCEKAEGNATGCDYDYAAVLQQSNVERCNW